MAIILYGGAISDALRDNNTSMDELITLRDHANAILEQQGDLKGALAQLDEEIQRRGTDSAS